MRYCGKTITRNGDARNKIYKTFAVNGKHELLIRYDNIKSRLDKRHPHT